jgi:pSer/pThr/pTyr-binding forkhead associated (FHA) protein
VAIEDLKSVNGTHGNYERVTRCELKPDDVIVIGDFQIRVRGS